jgi:CRP-like cAMP-binding protein
MNYGTMKKSSEYSQVLLNSFNPEQQLKNDEWFELHTFKNGQTVYHQGNTPMGVYYIKSGKVKFTRLSDDGTRHIIRIGTEGDFLGYEDVLLERKYSNTIEAWGDVMLWFIPRKDFMEVLDNDIKASRSRRTCWKPKRS